MSVSHRPVIISLPHQVALYTAWSLTQFSGAYSQQGIQLRSPTVVVSRTTEISQQAVVERQPMWLPAAPYQHRTFGTSGTLERHHANDAPPLRYDPSRVNCCAVTVFAVSNTGTTNGFPNGAGTQAAFIEPEWCELLIRINRTLHQARHTIMQSVRYQTQAEQVMV